jgi:hypothetical protein
VRLERASADLHAFVHWQVSSQYEICTRTLQWLHGQECLVRKVWSVGANASSSNSFNEAAPSSLSVLLSTDSAKFACLLKHNLATLREHRYGCSMRLLVRP